MINPRNLRGVALEDYKATLLLNEEQKDIILGTLLGDSTMGLRKGLPLYSIKFEQSITQMNYINHLAEKFADFCGSPPQTRWVDIQRTRQSIWFRTYRHNSLIFFFNLFYVIEKDPKTGKSFSRKVVSKNIGKFLNERVLAYWFMDDGTFHQDQYGNRQYYFSTQGFTKEDCQRLCDALDSRFQIKANVQKDKNYWRLYIRRESKELFVKSISPYLLSDFFYKISS